MHLSKLHQTLDPLQSQHHLQQALDYFNRIIELRLSVTRLSFETASAYDSIGKAYLVNHDHKHALNCFEQALSIKR